MTYRGATFEEMDLDAVLARRPKVALIDELAHTNVPRDHTARKRWEDVLELLEAGIAVISTLNVQHIESIADAVETMTGAKVRERVPDWVVRRADQIELIDSSPEQLRRRMLHGNIYPAPKVPSALQGFFKTQNLVALRELALRFVADEAEEDLLEYLRERADPHVWETTERVLAVVTGQGGDDGVVHRAARIAARLKSPLEVALVSGGERTGRLRGRLDELRQLATDVGAPTIDVGDEDSVRRDRRPRRAAPVDPAGRRSPSARASGSQAVLDARRLLPLAASRGIDVHVIARPPDGADEP